MGAPAPSWRPRQRAELTCWTTAGTCRAQVTSSAPGPWHAQSLRRVCPAHAAALACAHALLPARPAPRASRASFSPVQPPAPGRPSTRPARRLSSHLGWVRGLARLLLLLSLPGRAHQLPQAVRAVRPVPRLPPHAPRTHPPFCLPAPQTARSTRSRAAPPPPPPYATCAAACGAPMAASRVSRRGHACCAALRWSALR